MTLTSNITIQFLHKTLWFMIMYYVQSNQIWISKRISSSKDTEKNYLILIIWALAVTMTLKIANQSFYMALWLLMMHHNTKFGSKTFGGLGDNMWTNINSLSLTCKLDPECNNPFFFFFTGQLGLLMMYHQTKFGCQGINSSDNIVARVIFWSYEPSLWPWPWRQQ